MKPGGMKEKAMRGPLHNRGLTVTGFLETKIKAILRKHPYYRVQKVILKGILSGK